MKPIPAKIAEFKISTKTNNVERFNCALNTNAKITIIDEEINERNMAANILPHTKAVEEIGANIYSSSDL